MARISGSRNKKKTSQASPSKGDSVKKAYFNATTCFQKGLLKEAEQYCRQILAANPTHGDAQHLLGTIRYREGSLDEAADLIRQAIASNQQVHHYHNTLGLALQAQGKLQDAIGSFNQALSLKPAYAGGWYNLGIAIDQAGRSAEAIDCFRKAWALRPDDAALLKGIGDAFKSHDLPEEAVSCYERALKLAPGDADTMNGLGITLKMARQSENALKWLEKAVHIQPGSSDFHNNLGVVLKDLGQSERATECYNKAIALDPANHYALHNLAIELRAKNLFDEALEMANRSLQLCNDYALVHDFFANIQLDLGNFAISRQHFQKALELDPMMATTRSSFLFSLNYDPDVSADYIFAMHQKVLREHPAEIVPFTDHSNTRDKYRRIKVGYLSPDYIWHSVAFFLYPLLNAHHSDDIEIFCYADITAEDEMTARFRQLPHTWRSVGMLTDQALEAQIRNDQIDILVDLAGLSSRNRWTMLAAKPAPIQINYLGYPNTTGLKAMDFRITDEWADPPGASDQRHTEKLIRLPRTFLSFQPPANAPDVSSLPASRNGFVTFGSFNNRSKINENTISLWSKILQAVPGSRLFLKHKVFASEIGRSGIYRAFETFGIGSDRIMLASFVPNIMGHLALYADVDVALDTFPYNGTTTTCEALWMGVPVITLAGDRHASRVSTSILKSIGMDAWIAQTPDEYLDKAISLANDLSLLADYRLKLRDMMRQSAILDAKDLACNLESTYRSLWHEWCCRKIDLADFIRGQKAPEPEEPLFIDLRNVRIPGLPVEEQLPATDHIDRTAAELLNQQGEELAAAGRSDEAMAHFRKAIERCPDWVVPINNIGVMHWQAGNRQAAIEWMGKAYHTDPNHRETIQNLAEMMVQIDRSDSAFLITQSYLRRHPEDQDITSLSKNLRPPIRIMHHMARSGGTILCKCLGCMNKVFLLSEVHPYGMQWFDPLVQAYQWFNLFSKDEFETLNASNLSFYQKIVLIYERAVGQNHHLVLRDWSHLDYTGAPFVSNPSYSLTTAMVLQEQFNIVRIATVRHPIDQWLSLSRLAVMNGQIDVPSFMLGYRRFAECAREIGFIRYEDFTRDPQTTMQTICRTLTIDYDGSFIDKWQNYATITGDTKSERGSIGFIKPMPRRPVDKKLLELFESSKDYWDSLAILGYD